MDWPACLDEVVPGVVSGTLVRLVESQSQVATTRLVSSLDRQALLEEMLEGSKPPLPAAACRLHYLLASPFRYPPLRHGSRFGRRHEPSLFYGAREIPTVLAEAAYYRFLFWQGMAVPPAGRLLTQHTLFGAAYRADPGLRLQDPPFAAHQAVLADRSDYGAPQTLGSLMRDRGMVGFEFVSARDPAAGINVALYTPAALESGAPLFQQAWSCETQAERVGFRAHHDRVLHEFPLDLFLVGGELPRPATG